jgi:hypothetical protein
MVREVSLKGRPPYNTISSKSGIKNSVIIDKLSCYFKAEIPISLIRFKSSKKLDLLPLPSTEAAIGLYTSKSRANFLKYRRRDGISSTQIATGITNRSHHIKNRVLY